VKCVADSYVVRFKKTQVVIDGEERIIVMIKDYSDSINFHKNELQTKEDNYMLNIINQDLDSVFSEHCVTLDTLINIKNKKAVMNINGEAVPGIKQLTALKNSCDELFLLFSQFKDIFGIRLGNFKANHFKFKPLEFFRGIFNAKDSKRDMELKGNVH